jgi:hypothetical protein
MNKGGREHLAELRTGSLPERAKHAVQIVQEGPRGHHRTRRPMAKAVCHVGRHRRRDAQAQQPPRQCGTGTFRRAESSITIELA